MLLVRLAGSVALLTCGAFYPFLPGAYDGLAVAVSLVAQVLGLAGLLFVPIGALWLAHEARTRASRKTNLPATAQHHYYAHALVIGYVAVAAIVAVVAWASSGLAFGCGTLALSACLLFKLLPRLEPAALKAGSLPLYLTVAPMLAFLLQVLLADPMTEFSRQRAIASSAPLIDDLEKYHATHGQYPDSLSGVWPDYKVSVVGIQQFHYAPHGETYNLYFEQHLPVVSAPGTREFVVYNKRGQHLMLSHAAWNLTRPPERLANAQGWYAVHDTSDPDWKSFRFD